MKQAGVREFWGARDCTGFPARVQVSSLASVLENHRLHCACFTLSVTCHAFFAPVQSVVNPVVLHLIGVMMPVSPSHITYSNTYILFGVKLLMCCIALPEVAIALTRFCSSLASIYAHSLLVIGTCRLGQMLFLSRPCHRSLRFSPFGMFGRD